MLLFLSQLVQAKQATEVDISGAWKFKPGDDSSWAVASFDDTSWAIMGIPQNWPVDGFPETGQIAWYRLTVSVDDLGPEFFAEPGIRIGAMRSAYEIFVEGKKLGGIGSLPPDAAENFDRYAVYRIPGELVGSDHKLVIAMRVWGGTNLGVSKSGAGATDGRFLVGNYTKMLQELYVEQIPSILFVTVFVFVGLYFLYLFLRNRVLKSFLWFGLTAIVLGIYVITQSQWKYLFGFDFVTFEKIETGFVLIFFVLLIQLFWTIVDRRVLLLMRLYQVAFILLAVTIVLTPGLDIHHHVRRFWQISVLFSLIPLYWVVGQQVWRGHREARTLSIGLVIFTLCGVNDLLINMQLVHSVRLIPVGFLAVLVCMVVSLANQFTRMLVSLEQQVEDRTAELVSVNQQLAAANESLNQLARRDALTGLLNRRGFIDEAEIERQRFIRTGESLALVVADIDYFKQFNDRYGHACGDFVLSKIGSIMQEQIRDVDRVARWGGEEFVLLLPNTNAEGALRITEKLRQKIEAAEFDYEDQVLKVTMTFGGGICQKDESLEACLERADAALYEGKLAGRNRVIMATI